jgi:hypothetical protein
MSPISAKAPQVVGPDWYRKYYDTKGADRNRLLHNPEVLYQNLAQEAARRASGSTTRSGH